MQATNVVSMPYTQVGAALSYKTLAIMGTFCAGYLLVAELGSLLNYPSSMPLIWPPAGLALAAIVLFGSTMWPAIALGALVFCLISALPLSLTTIITTAVTLQALLGGYILRKLKFDPLLARVSDTISLFAVAAATSLVVPAATASALIVGKMASPSDFFGIIAPLWLGHALSMSILAPFVIRWARLPYPRTHMEFFEAAAAMTVLIMLDVLIFMTPYGQLWGVPLIYLILLPLLWISLRVGPRGMTLALVITSSIALAAVSFGGWDIAAPALLGIYINTEILLLALAVLFLIFVSSEEGRKDALIAVRGYVEKLEKALQQIRAEDRTKSEFIAILAHELRNPLAAIRTSVEVIGMELNNDRIQPLITAIDDRVKTTVRLLDDLLDISRISRRKLELRKEVVDMQEIIERSIQSVRPQIANRGHTVQIVLSGECRVTADPMRLEQILTNLLTNAIKYTSAGGAISVTCRRNRDQVVVAISDTGIGIPPNMRERIFEPFVQINNSSYGNSGLGIGLSLTKQLVEMHGGTIEATSPGEGQGSTFTATFPAAADETERQGSSLVQGLFKQRGSSVARQKTVESSIPQRPKQGLRILVVDDNQLAAQGLCKLLSMRGFDAESAYTGEHAISRVQEWQPEVLILDIGLPGMNGYEVAETLRAQGYGGVIIALTGYGQERDRLKATESGFDRHLVKPVGLAEIETMLKEVLKV